MAAQIGRFPDWHNMLPGPENPPGTHAMYPSWPACLIHGTQDARKIIGRRSSDGGIGLSNEKIAELAGIVPVGTHARRIWGDG